ncbi:MAG: hypothetical protein ACLP0J_16020 [Solirubrobacteraceae bacterium]
MILVLPLISYLISAWRRRRGKHTRMSVPFDLARDRVPIAVAVVSGVLVIAGCGSSSSPSSPTKSASNLAAAAISYAACMRSHRVPSFPDPSTSGGSVSFSLKSSFGINPASPAFHAAQTACDKLLPGGAPRSGQPSVATEAHMRAIAECMRAHGVSGFPDPTTIPPSGSAGYSGVLDRNGVSFVIPTTIDLQSPAVQRAATHCRLRGLGQGG